MYKFQMYMCHITKRTCDVFIHMSISIHLKKVLYIRSINVYVYISLPKMYAFDLNLPRAWVLNLVGVGRSFPLHG